MKKKNQSNIWGLVARLILRNRILILAAIIALTGFWASQWKYMQFTFTEANLLPDDHPENILYQSFVNTFGEEGNVIVIAVEDTTFFSPKKRNAWRQLNDSITAFKEINFVLSIDNLQELTKDTQTESFKLETVKLSAAKDSLGLLKFKQKLFLELPFYNNLIYNSETNTIRTLIYMDPDIVNTAARKDFIFKTFIYYLIYKIITQVESYNTE